MSSQHLSDEAVAAFADGVLSGHARGRAGRHTTDCAECAHAVRVQREAAWTLRSAVAPPLPSSLLDRLRSVPQTTEIVAPPTVVGPDGSTMLATFAPMAALVPTRPLLSSQPLDPSQHQRTGRARPIITAAAVVVLAGAAVAGSSLAAADPSRPATDHIVRQLDSPSGPQGGTRLPGVMPVNVFRTAGH